MDRSTLVGWILKVALAALLGTAVIATGKLTSNLQKGVSKVG